MKTLDLIFNNKLVIFAKIPKKWNFAITDIFSFFALNIWIVI